MLHGIISLSKIKYMEKKQAEKKAIEKLHAPTKTSRVNLNFDDLSLIVDLPKRLNPTAALFSGMMFPGIGRCAHVDPPTRPAGSGRLLSDPS